MVGCSTSTFGQDYAKTIAKSLKDPSKACTTEDGQRGTLRITGRETTTSTTYGNSDTKNSGRDTYGGTAGTSGINANYSHSSGTNSNTQNQTTTTTTKITEKCFPNRY